MAFKLGVLIALTVFIKHDVLCFQPAFTERKKLVLPIRGHDQWRNKVTQLQMYETTQIYDVCRRMVRGSKYAVSTILFTKSIKSKLIALAHTLFIFVFISCIASLIHYIPQFMRDIPWVSIRKIFDESNLKREQWVSDMNLLVKPKLDTFKMKFSVSVADLMNVMNRVGDQTSSLRIGAIADVVNVSGNVMEKSHVIKSRSFEYRKERDTVVSDYFEENIANIDGISYTSNADISGDCDTSMGTNSELEEILKHSKILIGSGDYDTIDEYNRDGNAKEHNLSTPLPLNHGNGGYGIDQYHTLSTPLFLTTTPLAQIKTLQLTPVAYTLESRDAVASLQSYAPPSALIPTFYPFSRDVDSVFAVSSFLPSSSSSLSDKVKSDQSIVLYDKGIDVGLIGMTSADHTDEVLSPDYLPLMSPKEVSPSRTVFDHIPDDILPQLLPHVSLVTPDVTTPFNPESSNSETVHSLNIGSSHESHKDGSKASLQSYNPPSALIPTFYPFSRDDDSSFAVSSFLPSSSSSYSISDKVESDQSMKESVRAVETLEQQLVDLRLQAVKGAEEVQRLVSMINAEIKEEEDQVEAQKKIDEISSSGSSGTIIDTKSDIVRDERDHFSHFSDPSPAIEHDSLFAISSPPSSFSDNVDEHAMTTNDKHIEVEVEKEVEIVPKEHVKNLNERIENRALEMLQELSLAREREEEKLLDLTRRVEIEEEKLKKYALLSDSGYKNFNNGKSDASSSSNGTMDSGNGGVKEKKIYGRRDRSSQSGQPSPTMGGEVSSEVDSAARAAALAVKAQKWIQSAVTTAFNPESSNPETVNGSHESHRDDLNAKEVEKELMRIEAAEAVQEIEATLAAISKEAFAVFAKYVNERI